MKARNELEAKVLEMVQNGIKVKGYALDILIEMSLRESEEQKGENSN